MSSDNRLCVLKVDQYNDEKDYFGIWYVWEGSASVDYFEPPPNAKKFNTENEVKDYISELEKVEGGYYEYGVCWIDDYEQMKGMRAEIEYLKQIIDDLTNESKGKLIMGGNKMQGWGI